MDRKKRLLSIFVFVVLVHFFITTTGVMASSKKVEVNKPVAEVLTGPNGISWIPKVDYHRIVLNVAGPDGEVISKTFKAGSALYFDLSSTFADRFPDGSYTYELRVIPVGVVEGEVRKSSQKTVSQTGYFNIQGGMIVTGAAPEAGNAPETGIATISTGGDCSVEPDCPCYAVNCDAIVVGSLCVGGDCLNPDDCNNTTNGCNGTYKPTFKLKEENIRLLFQDTTTDQNYPTNDWQIVINDDTPGGGEYFSIQDVDACTMPFTIEAGAPDNSVYVCADGDVGIGTSTPEIHSAVEIERTGKNTKLLLERTDAHFRYNPNDIIPSLAALEAHIDFVSVGSRSNHPLRLICNNKWKMRFFYKGSDTEVTMQMWDRGYYDGTWNNASSRELKENIKNLTADEAMEALEGLNPVKYNYKTYKEENHVGFIAEDVPELVAAKERKTTCTMDVVAVLTKVVQEQQKTISELKQKMAEFEKKLKEQ